jgi:hypothetical protein
MLTPFALWLGLGLFGPGGAAVRIDTKLGAVLLGASLPLAGLFWIQNLRQLGDSIGRLPACVLPRAWPPYCPWPFWELAPLGPLGC